MYSIFIDIFGNEKVYTEAYINKKTTYTTTYLLFKILKLRISVC